MSRLQSLYGPSSPLKSPIPGQSSNNPTPASSPKGPGGQKGSRPGQQAKNSGTSNRTPSRRQTSEQEPPSIYALSEPNTEPPRETTFHRKLRATLLELKGVIKTWNELVLVDGLKAAKALIDARTELDNAIASLPPGTQPRSRIVIPKLTLMEQKIEELHSILTKLAKQFQKMTTLVDSADALLIEAVKMKGFLFATSEPLWNTWPLERFVLSLPTFLPSYHRSLAMCQKIVSSLKNHAISFEGSRNALREWAAQPCLAEGKWQDLEDLIAIEVDGWLERAS